MGLNEYAPGTAFTGRMGRTVGESAAGMARARARETRRAERAVHRARRHRLRPARLLRLADQHAEPRPAGAERPALHQHAHDGAVLAVALVHAHRPQPPLQRHVVHHRGLDRLPRLQRRHPVRERLPLRDAAAARLRHLLRRQVAPDAGRADQRGRALRPLAARPRLRALLRLPRRRHPPVLPRPRLRQPSGRAAEDARRRATTSPTTWPTRPSSSSPTPSRSRPTSPSSCTSPPAPSTRRTTCRRSGPTSTRASSTTGWDAYREKVFARQKELGIIAEDAELSRHDPDVQQWDDLSADERKLYARMMEVFAGFLEHTDHHIGRAARLPRGASASSTTRSSWSSPTTAPAPRAGRTARSTRTSSSTTCPTTCSRTSRRSTTSAARSTSTTTPWGWTFAGNTPFRRWKRETYRGGVSDPFIVHWPEGHQGQGRDPHAVRARHRHGADGARLRSASRRRREIRGVTQSPIEGVSFAHAFDDAEAPDQAPHAVLRDVRPPLDLSRRLARGVPVPGHVVHRGGRRLRRSSTDRGQAARARRERLGALPRRRGLRRDQQPRRAGTRQADRDDRPLVRRGRQVQRAAARQPRHHALRRRASADRRRRATPTSTIPGTQMVPENVAVKVLNRPHSITVDAEIADGRRRRACLPRRQRRRLLAVRPGRQAALRLQLRRRRGTSSVVRRPVPPEGTRCATNSNRPGTGPDGGQGHAGYGKLFVDGELVGQAELPVTVPLALGLGSGFAVGRNPGLAASDAIRLTVRVHRHDPR